MASDDDDEPDLMLVSTYIPVLISLLKATCLVIFSEMLTFIDVQKSVKFVAHCAILNIDFNRMRQDKFERACGFLFFVAISIYLREQEPVFCQSLFSMMTWVADTAWAILASTWTMLNFIGMNGCIPFYGIVLCSALFASAHVLGCCVSFSALELIVRCFVFIIMCSVMFFGKRSVRNLDRNLYTKSIPFMCSHVLVVSVYIMIPSFLIMICGFLFITYRSGDRGMAAQSFSQPCTSTCNGASAHSGGAAHGGGHSQVGVPANVDIQNQTGMHNLRMNESDEHRLCLQLRAAIAAQVV